MNHPKPEVFPLQELMLMDPQAVHRLHEAPQQREAVYERAGRVAIIRVDGPLLQRGGCWWDGYEAIKDRFAEAGRDPSVGGVLLRICSYGGVVSGCFESVRAMRLLKKEFDKPVVAFADEAAYSGALAVATAADKIYLPEPGGVGSVGVIAALFDVTAWNQKAGFRVVIVTSGGLKADGHPDVPLSDEVIARCQERINDLGGQFAALVGEARGKTKDEILALEAGCFYGARAVEAGLADGVMSFAEALARTEALATERLVSRGAAKNEDRQRDAGAGGTDQTRVHGGEPAGPRGRGADDDAPDGAMHVRQAVVRAVRPEAREVDLVASTEAIDTYRSILRANWDLKRFRDCPVLLWMHGRQNDHPPVGTVRDMAVKGKVLGGTAVFDDTTEFDRAIFSKYEKGVLRGFSVGFRPLEVAIEEIDGEEIVVFKRCELLELSCVNVPSNAEALARAQDALMNRVRLDAHAARVAGAPGPIPYYGAPKVESDEWDEAAAEQRVRAWATRTDGTIDWGRYGSAFGWVNPGNRSSFDGYKLLHHDVRDGRLVSVLGGVREAGASLSGALPGQIPSAHVPRIRAHIAREFQQFGLAPPWEDRAASKAARHGRHGDLMEIKTTDAVTDIRAADGGGLTCRATCPCCNETIEVGIRTVPTDPRKESELAEARTQLSASEARGQALQTLVTDMTRQLVDADVAGARRDLEALSGSKVFPAELDHELALARAWLLDRTLQKDDTAGRTVGQVRWADHLNVIRARPDLNVISSASGLPKDPNPAKAPEPAPETRTAGGKKVTTAGNDLVTKINARA